MTSRERLLAAMRLERPDRVPVAPFLNLGWLDQAGPAMAERIVRECDVLLEVGSISGISMVLGKQAAGITRSWTEGNSHYTAIDTPKGELRSAYTTTEKTGCTTEFFFKGPEDVERFLSVPYEPMEVDTSAYHQAAARFGEELLVMGSCIDAAFVPGFWFSPEDFMLNCMEDFDLIKLLLDTVQPRLLDYVRSCKKGGVQGFRIIGAELASQTLMSPPWFPRLVLPYDAELHAEMRRDGGFAHMHCHGKITEILEQVADTGPTTLDPLEGPPGGNLELADAKRRIGDRVCLLGNLDDLQVIGVAGREKLTDLSLACIEAAGPDGYMLGGTTSGIYTPEIAEGFLTMAEAARRSA